MKLKTKVNQNTHAANIVHFNMEEKHYVILPEGTEVPDADAKIILAVHPEVERAD